MQTDIQIETNKADLVTLAIGARHLNPLVAAAGPESSIKIKLGYPQHTLAVEGKWGKGIVRIPNSNEAITPSDAFELSARQLRLIERIPDDAAINYQTDAQTIFMKLGTAEIQLSSTPVPLPYLSPLDGHAEIKGVDPISLRQALDFCLPFSTKKTADSAAAVLHFSGPYVAVNNTQLGGAAAHGRGLEALPQLRLNRGAAKRLSAVLTHMSNSITLYLTDSTFVVTDEQSTFEFYRSEGEPLKIAKALEKAKANGPQIPGPKLEFIRPLHGAVPRPRSQERATTSIASNQDNGTLSFISVNNFKRKDMATTIFKVATDRTWERLIDTDALLLMPFPPTQMVTVAPTKVSDRNLLYVEYMIEEMHFCALFDTPKAL